ncbi:MAG TPA: low affinity iron permease family protein [Ignavibacteria bacterium]|nr:low affinity iron permease family protein [Ignavibacteria bacterium]
MARKRKNDLFEELSIMLTRFTGSTPAFILSLSLVAAWALSGPLFSFSETWQLVINTGTTIITFLMVFLIQRTQNKDSMAIQLKLNELIASSAGASNRMVEIEDISEAELEILKKHYSKLARLFEEEKNLKVSHSIEEAEKRHLRKVSKR